LEVSSNVKIAMQCFENFGGSNAPIAPAGCAPDGGACKDLGCGKSWVATELCIPICNCLMCSFKFR